ncbi:PP2C family protein-serine/threonine phosphatase [Ovoidimarina sediminis]|uniref:PP2C family protein-serine/threonine phosphatase n=1 Tax=Ovoidimarina sediminis TaxID=3079856 RepID=UPI00290E3BD7|nr:protein phosphatase 2C domain-containing protein [Rhodophyticola sp. MJ-SS7]MDU8943348.1 protein phosphatase 2C domain-containing protein [Rhodophyticola sp. MJ-SS7]
MPRNEATYDATSALIRGARDHQEDAVIVDFPVGSPLGMVVLADGMGGHAAGDVASKIVMTEVFCELKFQTSDAALEGGVRETLLAAAQGANECIAAHIAEHPEAEGMGATLIGLVMEGERLNWVSIGDSPLYLFRAGALTQLNEDHSMAPQIDQMIASGQIDAETGKNHPDRNALLSVLSGDEIARIDCPKDGVALEHADIVIAASDGIQFLDHEVIEGILRDTKGKPSQAIATALIKEIEALGDPDQDNTSIAVIKVELDQAQSDMAAALQAAFHTFETAEPSERMFEPPERVRSHRKADLAETPLPVFEHHVAEAEAEAEADDDAADADGMNSETVDVGMAEDDVADAVEEGVTATDAAEAEMTADNEAGAPDEAHEEHRGPVRPVLRLGLNRDADGKIVLERRG